MKIKKDGIIQEIETISTGTIEAVISRDEMQCAIHQGILDKENLVLISIGEPGEFYKYSILSKEEVQGFKDCLQIEFWDVEEDFGDYTIITDEEAKTIQNFILVNLQKDPDTRFIVNCKAGKSRSAAVAKAIECIKFFGIGEEAKYNYKTSFDSEISKHSRYCPNLTVFDKIVKDYNQAEVKSKMKEEYLKEIKKIDKQISKLYTKQNTIKDELLKYRISTGNYISGTDLIELPNYTRINIDVILDSNLEEVYIPDGEGVYIQDGRLDCSSYSEGLLYFSDNDKCYIYSYRYSKQKLDIKYILLKED